jgi:peptidyl-prolyl cis-trans isomerase D
MLQTLRNNMKLVLWITISAFVLLIFLVWGADLQFGGRAGSSVKPNTVGVVNGEPILASTYQQVVSLNRQNAQAQGRELEPSEELRIEEESWGLLVDQILMNQEAKKRGLRAHDSEVRAVLLNSPPPMITQNSNFQDAQGKFDFARFQAVLRDPATPVSFLLQLEAYVRDYLPIQKLQTLVQSSAKVTEEEVRRAYLQDSEKAKITFVLLDASRVPVDQNVSDADLEAYFREHAEEYRMARRVSLTYLLVPRRAAALDSLRVRQDLLEMADEARQAETSRQRGQENLGVSDFATLAASFSQAPGAEEGGLMPGFSKPAEMSPTLAAAVSGLAPGQVTEPYLDGGFYHIAQVAEVKDEDGQRSYRLRDLGVRIAPSDSTVQAEQDRLEKIRQSAATSSLKNAAQVAGLGTREARDVLSTGIVPGLFAIPGIGAWAHQKKSGTVSRVFSASNGWYLVEVGTFEPEGTPALAGVKDRVRNDILRRRRLDASRSRAEALAVRARAGAGLEAAATVDSVQVSAGTEVSRATGVPGLGRDAEILAAAFHLPLGQVSDPIETQRGWVVFRVDERPPVDWAAFDGRKEQLRRARLFAKESQIMNQFLEELRQKSTIVDYRT